VLKLITHLVRCYRKERRLSGLDPESICGDEDGPRIKSGETGERSGETGERSGETGEKSGETGEKSGETGEGSGVKEH
jgi:hypothetical protein